MKLKAVFFDLDGTLLDSERIYQYFWKKAVISYCLDPNKADFLLLRSLDHTLADSYLQSVYPSVSPDFIRQKRIALMEEYVKTHPFTLKEGAKETLETLCKRGFDLYLVSASPLIKLNSIMKEYGLEQYFVSAISAKSQKRGKPFPDVYTYALAAAGVKAEEALTIEDSPAGAWSAIQAGISTVFIDDLSPAPKGMKPYLKKEIHVLNELIILMNSILT